MMRTLFTSGLLVLLIISCTSQRVSERDHSCRPVTWQDFLNQPFHVGLSVDSVDRAYGGRFRLTRLLREVGHKDGAKDTIYRFHNKHTSLLFYTTSSGKESFLTSKIADRSLELRPCLRVGMSRIRVEELITGFPSDFQDTVTLHNDQRQAVFIFRESRLKTVVINNFFK